MKKGMLVFLGESKAFRERLVKRDYLYLKSSLPDELRRLKANIEGIDFEDPEYPYESIYNVEKLIGDCIETAEFVHERMEKIAANNQTIAEKSSASGGDAELLFQSGINFIDREISESIKIVAALSAKVQE